MATLNIANDKDTVGLVQYRSDGDTIPFVATSTHAIGDVVVRNSTENKIGVVQGLQSPDDSAATVSDQIALRVEGMFWAPKDPATAMSDGDLLIWSSGAQRFEKQAEGPHECVGGYDASDEYVLVRINVAGSGGVNATPSASASATPSASAS